MKFLYGFVYWIVKNDLHIFGKSACLYFSVGVGEDCLAQAVAADEKVVVQVVDKIWYTYRLQAGAVAEAVFVERRHFVGYVKFFQ